MTPVDLTDRQRELAAVALRIVAEEGIAGVTFRSVATASGWSLGAVQKAFSSKAEMYAAMFATLRQAAGPGPSQPPGTPTVHDWICDLVLSILPLDQARRDLTLQGQAFADRAAYDTALASAIARGDDELRTLLASLVAKGQETGEIPAAVNPQEAAWAILALTQGLAAQLLYDPLSEHTASTRVRSIFATVLQFDSTEA